MNKAVSLDLQILEISKTVMYEFWYDYWKPKLGEKSKLSLMDTGSFIVYIKPEDIYVDIAKYVETRFNTSNDEIERPLPKGKNKKVVGLIKDQLRGKIMKEFAVVTL